VYEEKRTRYDTCDTDFTRYRDSALTEKSSGDVITEVSGTLVSTSDANVIHHEFFVKCCFNREILPIA
jgi:hypothetical protein